MGDIVLKGAVSVAVDGVGVIVLRVGVFPAVDGVGLIELGVGMLPTGGVVVGVWMSLYCVCGV